VWANAARLVAYQYSVSARLVPRVVLRRGSLYFGTWPPSLRERPSRGVYYIYTAECVAATATVSLAMLK
jgi:hypothetical protein